MSTRYLPVDPDYHEMIREEMAKSQPAIIHYFNNDNTLGEEKQVIKGLVTNPVHEEYVVLEQGHRIRIDRIIVVNGKPGPAYDEYDAYALACLDCMGGMD